jgi:hypothetical protein
MNPMTMLAANTVNSQHGYLEYAVPPTGTHYFEDRAFSLSRTALPVRSRR